MSASFRFNRMEFAGSLGDLGTILPLAVGMIMINGMHPTGVFLGFGLFYILSGMYFRVTCPAEPMKVISSYALATGISVGQIQASCLWFFLLLLILGTSGMITSIGKIIRKPVIRGVQLATGLMLVMQGVKLMAGTSPMQLIQHMAEPNMTVQAIGPIQLSWLIGGLLGLLALLLLDNKHLPAAIIVVATGIGAGLLFSAPENLERIQLGIFLPALLPYGLPTLDELTIAFIVLVLPQLPMTVGNAIISNADLTGQYFPDTGKRVTYRSLCLSMALANIGSFFIGGIPMCHGAGGLASRYRFGARTAGSNLIIGGIFLGLVFFLGPNAVALINLIPFSALGVLLIFAGLQLALTLLDLQSRKEMVVPIMIVGITLASNLAAGFVIGILFDTLLRWDKINI
ncbi:putative sulfate/molybdate transporter [Desulfogranum marinum]|uniref:putative sulfate/molybdate transporter n=1 Tax=Desulfogranum marinum TaxID=453220 RepID=UPI0029C68A30|nr:putative sulfate/molybdate transporter [Desulfogranum marinum]